MIIKQLLSLTISAMTLMLVTLGLTTGSFGESGFLDFKNNGLSFQYPSHLKLMNSTSTRKIQHMLNQQLQGMGNTQVSVVALDVLLNLPAFRVMIAKERFLTAPTPDYLIEERKHFLHEAQQRGMVQSYGAIKKTRIAGHPAIEFHDLDQGAQGYGSRVRILCGKDTWNISFTGSSSHTYRQNQEAVTQIINSMTVLETC
ncbi:MAG: hypothetical protein MRJ96_03235 [Nitrospirales bacterium]|nr:hypothetical protein [Nitrospira sp.]MDR4500452.1 hypothetical protein [Nitrospirales bacterium]